ncbi:hypothetical protein JXA56_04885 [Candidatus Micrarchaeota archaeon]|nr:hypothetical protein [Candidatus Micrarchaeota archaeon]
MGSEPAKAIRIFTRAKQLKPGNFFIRQIPSPPKIPAELIEQVNKTNDSIAEIRLKKLAAESLLSRCDDQKKQLGEGYHTEQTKAHTIISLASSIDEIYQKAIDAQNPHALAKIYIASRMLSIHIERYNLLNMEIYPPGEIGRYVSFSIIANITSMYEKIKNVLGPLPEKFGVKLSEF